MFTGAMFDGQKLRLTSPAYPCGYPCGYVAATGQSSGGATRYVAATGWLCARVGGARSWRARSGEVSMDPAFAELVIHAERSAPRFALFCPL